MFNDEFQKINSELEEIGYIRKKIIAYDSNEDDTNLADFLVLDETKTLERSIKSMLEQIKNIDKAISQESIYKEKNAKGFLKNIKGIATELRSQCLSIERDFKDRTESAKYLDFCYQRLLLMPDEIENLEKNVAQILKIYKQIYKK